MTDIVVLVSYNQLYLNGANINIHKRCDEITPYFAVKVSH